MLDNLRSRDKDRRMSSKPRGPDYQRDKAWMERRKDPNTTDLGIDEMGSHMKSSSHKSSRSHHKSSSHAAPMPILLVPNARSATLNMFNVKGFLQDGLFTEVQEAMKAKPHKVQKIFIKSSKFVSSPDFPKMFEVIDNIKGLKERDWPRVAAVIVQGPEWQFKGWRWKDPPDIMSKVTGFHLCYDNVEKHANVLKWAVKILEVSKENRHKDLTLAKLFWAHLQSTMAVRQASLSGKRKRGM